MKLNFPEKPVSSGCNKTSQNLKFPLSTENFNLWMMKKDMQGKSQDDQNIAEINYSQFRNKLMDRKDHNSTFQKTNIIIPGNINIEFRKQNVNYLFNFYLIHYFFACILTDIKELEKLKKENKKLLDDFITKDGETVFLRQQLQQNQLRTENEKLEKMRLIEEQANQHRSEINQICKEKEQLKTQLELQVSIYFLFLYIIKTRIIYNVIYINIQSLEIKNLLERCKLLESGNIKLREPQTLYMNNSLNKSKYSNPTNW